MTGDIVTSSRNLRPVTIQSYGECRVVTVGKMEIWDGAELALLRETIRRLVEDEGCRTLGVDMKYVKYVPSGFFGTLCDWHDKGICIRLLSPLPRIRQMLWFMRFFHSIGGEFHELFPTFESDFDEPDSGRDKASEPAAASDFPLTSNDEPTSNVPVHINGNARYSAIARILRQ